MNQSITLTYLNKKQEILAWLFWEGQRLVDAYFEKQTNTFEVGSIYLGKVKKIIPSLNGAFVEISPGVQGYLNVKGNVLPKQEEELLVQVLKEAHHHKNIALTKELTLVGEGVILSSKHNFIRFSKKISKKRREELKTLLDNSAIEKDYGIVFRTIASEKNASELLEEICNLTQKMDDIIRQSKYRTCYCLLYKDQSFIQSIKKKGVKILTNDETLYQLIQNYQLEGKLILADGRQLPLEAIYPMNTQLERLSSKKVWLKSGAYLFIESTEAFISIDVNSGKNVPSKKGSQYFLKVNKEGLEEAFRQIRLRNLSGVILIDLIDMKEKEHQEEILMLAQTLAREDSLGIEVVEFSKLQFLVLTRKRRRPSLTELGEFSF